MVGHARWFLRCELHCQLDHQPDQPFALSLAMADPAVSKAQCLMAVVSPLARHLVCAFRSADVTVPAESAATPCFECRS